MNLSHGFRLAAHLRTVHKVGTQARIGRSSRRSGRGAWAACHEPIVNRRLRTGRGVRQHHPRVETVGAHDARAEVGAADLVKEIRADRADFRAIAGPSRGLRSSRAAKAPGGEFAQGIPAMQPWWA